MTTYDVSRATVRKAIESLIADGLLHRIHGKGTFVARPRLESRLHLASFSQDMRRRGLTPSTALLGIEADLPPADVATALGLGADALAWRLDRVRLADGQPIALENGWYPQPPLPDLDRQRPQRLALPGLRARPTASRIDAAEQTLWGEAADSARRAPARRPRPHPAARLPPRLARRRAALWSTSSRATAATATRSTCPWAVTDIGPGQHHHRREEPVSTSDASTGRGEAERRLQPRASPEVRPQPHAADRRTPRRGPAAAAGPAGPARRRRPGLGAASPPSSAPPATRSSRTWRCCSRSAWRSAWPRRPTARPRSPRSSATWCSRASVTRCPRYVLGAAGRGRDPGADQLRRARRHRDAA